MPSATFIRGRCIGVLVGALIAWPSARSQSIDAATALRIAPTFSGRVDASITPRAMTPESHVGIVRSATSVVDRARTAPWWSPVSSLFVPGSGQFALGQQRSVAYLVAEAYLVVQAYTARRDFRRDRDEYRSLAADVARRPFGGAQPIGGWDYYELMEKYLESGVYSKSTGGAIVPETDTSTYNGASWLLARENHWANPNVTPAVSSPEYQRALAEYSARAIRDEYRWSWRDAQLQQGLYRETIAQANRRSQRALNLAGLVGMNHLASMIDAYVSVRVRRYGGVRVAGARLDGIESSVSTMGDPALGRHQWRTALRLVPAR